MAKKPHNVKVIQYFFPETHVKAMEGHDPSGVRDGTVNILSLQIAEVESEKFKNGVTLTYETDDKASQNMPYSIKAVAFGLFEPVSAESEELVQDYRNNLEAVAAQVLFGAIREHIAAITARSPWSTFIAATVNLPQRQKGAGDDHQPQLDVTESGVSPDDSKQK